MKKSGGNFTKIVTEKDFIDFLTFRSWYANVKLHGLGVEKGRKLYKDALLYEEKLKEMEKENAT